MLPKTEAIIDTEDFQSEWLQTCQRFGSLVEAEALKALASQGFTEFGRGVVCLAIRSGQPCSFYLPGYGLSLVGDEPELQWQLLSRVKTYKPEKSEMLVLVTFDDIEVSPTSAYRYFYLSVD